MNEDISNLLAYLIRTSYVPGAVHDGPTSELKTDIPKDAKQVRLYLLPGCIATPYASCRSIGKYLVSLIKNIGKEKPTEPVLPHHQYVGLLDRNDPENWKITCIRKRDMTSMKLSATHMAKEFNVSIDTVLE